jgi:dipeptidyl aminopeptidase/acylaminoacyl peptidase
MVVTEYFSAETSVSKSISCTVAAVCFLVVTAMTGFREVHAEVAELTAQRAFELSALNQESGPEHGKFSWIPASHKLIYSERSNGDVSWIKILDADSGATTRIARGDKPEVSPDGRKMVYLASDEARAPIAAKESQLWVSNVDGTDARQLTLVAGGFDLSLRLANYHWSPDSTRILYGVADFQQVGSRGVPSVEVYSAQNGGMNFQTPSSLHLVEIRTGLDIELFHTREPVYSYGWLGPQVIFYSHSLDSGNRTDAKIVSRSLVTKEESVLVSGYNRNDNYSPVSSPSGSMIAFIADPGEAVRYPMRRELAFLSIAENKVSVLTKFALVSSRLSWLPDGKGLLFTDGRFNSRNLFVSDLRGHRRALTHENGKSTDAIVSSDGRLMTWQFTALDNRETLRLGHWDGNAIQDAKDMIVLNDPLKGFHIGKAEAVQWKSGDGALVDGVVVFPPNYDRSRRYPLLVSLHGGPESISATFAQSGMPTGVYFPYLMANEGYIVFSPDYRSSALMGYDKILAARDNNQMFEPDFNDIISGVDALIEKGTADPKRVFLIGHSYGSTETNWIITHSHRFRAAVSYEGGDVLTGWAWGGAKNHGPSTGYEWLLKGSPLQRLDVYLKESAVANVRGITTPTLFINCQYGVNDPCMVWLYVASQRQNIDSQFLYYRDEGHTLEDPANVTDLLQRVISWFKNHDAGVHGH